MACWRTAGERRHSTSGGSRSSWLAVDEPRLDGVLDEPPPAVGGELVDRAAQPADAELGEAVAEVVELAVELRDRPPEAAGDGAVRRQLVAAVRVAQRAFGEGEQQQPLLVGEHEVAEGDRLAALLVVGVERVVVVVVVVGAAVGDAHDDLVVGDAGAEAQDRVRERQRDLAARRQLHAGAGVGVGDLDRDRAALVGQPPGVAAGPEAAEHPVEVAVVVDVEVGLATERQLVARLDRAHLADEVDVQVDVVTGLSVRSLELVAHAVPARSSTASRSRRRRRARPSGPDPARAASPGRRDGRRRTCRSSSRSRRRGRPIPGSAPRGGCARPCRRGP